MTTWLPIPGFTGYEVSDEGQVRSYRKNPAGRLMRPAKNIRNHYRYAMLQSDSGKPTAVHVHRLVLLAFVGPKPDGLQTRHLDGDTENNRLDNLVYGTVAENAADRVRHGTSRVPTRRFTGPREVPDRLPGELTTAEAAVRLGYTRNNVTHLLKTGRLPFRRAANGRPLIPESAVAAWVYPKLGRPRKVVAA